MSVCANCTGAGLLPAAHPPKIDTENFPHVAIIGGGIGGVALAVACLHRGIPFTLFERDHSFDARAQGYGLTLQQASKAMSGLGITTLKEGLVSTRHVVHTTDGKIIGEWGVRKWMENREKKSKARKRIAAHRCIKKNRRKNDWGKLYKMLRNLLSALCKTCFRTYKKKGIYTNQHPYRSIN